MFFFLFIIYLFAKSQCILEAFGFLFNDYAKDADFITRGQRPLLHLHYLSYFCLQLLSPRLKIAASVVGEARKIEAAGIERSSDFACYIPRQGFRDIQDGPHSYASRVLHVLHMYVWRAFYPYCRIRDVHERVYMYVMPHAVTWSNIQWHPRVRMRKYVSTNSNNSSMPESNIIHGKQTGKICAQMYAVVLLRTQFSCIN